MATDFSKYQAKITSTPQTTDFSKYGATDGQVSQTTQPKQPLSDSIWSGLANVGIGAVKGAANTLQNIGNLALQPVKTGLNAVGINTPETGFTEQQLAPTNTAQKVGKFGEQVAEFAIPASKIGKVAEGASLAEKALNLGQKALTSGAVATAQEGKVGTGTGIAVGTELALPVVGKVLSPVKGIMSRLFKGLGSELSGVGSNTLESIIKEPKTAIKTSEQIVKNGQESVLENNAKTIVNGVSQIRKEASKAFGEGLQALKAEDINPTTFRQSIQPVLDSFGISTKGNTRYLDNVEFNSPTLLQKASNLIDTLSKTKLDGYSLRQTLEKIDNARFKTTGSDVERLSFNAFIDELSKGVKNAINQSTDKLAEINKKYSTDLQLTEGIEKIFGNVQFKNTSEINRVAKNLEGLFADKGLDPKTTDDFLKRIGINSDEFRATEATRQIMNKSMGANQVGTSISEMIRGVTSAVITPNTVKNIATYTGLAEDTLKQVLDRLSPVARGAFIKSLIDGNE